MIVPVVGSQLGGEFGPVSRLGREIDFLNADVQNNYVHGVQGVVVVFFADEAGDIQPWTGLNPLEGAAGDLLDSGASVLFAEPGPPRRPLISGGFTSTCV
jgi:hypothetical protein